MTDDNEYRDTSEISNWCFNPWGTCFGIEEDERKRAIAKLKRILPEEVFTVRGEEISYSGSNKKCAEDFADQLINHAIDIRSNGFSKTKLTAWNALYTMYGCNDVFFVGYDRINPVTLPSLLDYLERAGYGPTTFKFGCIGVLED